MFKALNFHTRVLLSFVALLVLCFAGAAIAMYVVADRTGRTLAVQQLHVAERVTDDALANRYAQLLNSTRTAAADYGLREAVTSADHATLVSALDNVAARLHASSATWITPSGTFSAGTDPVFVRQFAAGLPQAPDHGTPDDRSGPIVYFRDHLLSIVVVPVRAPQTVGYLCMAFVLSDELVTQVKDTAGVDVSLVVHQGDTARTVVSTLSDGARERLPAALNAFAAKAPVAHAMTLADVNYLVAVADSRPINDGYFSVALQIPTAAAIAPMVRLRHDLLIAGVAIMLICLIAAVLSSWLLAKPIRALTEATRSLSRSKRGRSEGGADNDDELARVAKAFHALLKRAQFDVLTGLPNRALLNERLLDSIARARETDGTFAVVFIDLNGFKQINDTLGHDMGDLVLRKTAQRLSRSLAPSHTVARLGGDEFVLILEDLASAAIIAEVNRLAQIVSMPMKSDAGPVKVGMSAGIAIYPDTALDRETLLKQADAAMYLAKQRKRGPVLATPVEIGKSEKSPRLVVVNPPPAAPATEASGLFGGATAERWADKDLATQTLRAVTSLGTQVRRSMAAGIPPDEVERVAALHQLKILDCPPSPAIDRITRLTARSLNMPMVLVSLVDSDRQWFMSKVGISESETPRELSFCAHAVFNREPLVVPDTTQDERFANHPMVKTAPGVRSYAGAPIYSQEGYALGTLCVVGRSPRDFSEESLATLQDFASVVQDLIRARERTMQRRRSGRR